MFICMITGHFKNFILINILIFFHEIGHITGALWFNYNIEKIVIYPLGGLTIFNDLLNRPLYQEFIIAIMGPIYQIIIYKLCMNIYPSTLLTNYHYALLMFNLLPIYPLDGSKILNVVLNTAFSYFYSHIISIAISIIVLSLSIIFIVIKMYSVFLIIILCLLWIDIIKEIKIHRLLFKRFLLERYLYKLKFNKVKVITNIKQMRKSYYHIFKIGNNIYGEEKKLSDMFDF